MASMASAFPNLRSMPSVSFRVKIPFSKHSMAQATHMDAVMRSIPYSSQISSALQRASMESTQQMLPKP